MSARILALVDVVVGLVARQPSTKRLASAEFGTPLGSRFAAELAAYSDLELVSRDRDELLAEIRAGKRSKAGAR